MSSKFRLFGTKSNSRSDDEVGGLDWDFMIQGGTVALALVKEAAELAPLPGLRQAAGTTLQIISVIQAVKDNKSAYRLLGDECTALIAVVYRSCQTSSSPETWPPGDLRAVIEDLVITLSSIHDYVKEKVDRSMTKRVFASFADSAKISEYRDKLRHAVNKFEISSHLTMNDALQHLLKGQVEIFRHLKENGIISMPEPTITEKVISKIHTMSIEDDWSEQHHSAFASSSRVPNPSRTQSAPAMPPPVAFPEPTPQDNNEAELLAAAERAKEKERRLFSGEKAREAYRHSSAESDDDDDDDMYEDDESDESEEPPPPKKSKKTKSTTLQATLPGSGMTATMDRLSGNKSASMPSTGPTMTASMGNMHASIPLPGWTGHPGHDHAAMLQPQPMLPHSMSAPPAYTHTPPPQGQGQPSTPQSYASSPQSYMSTPQLYPSTPHSYPSSPQPFPPTPQSYPPFHQPYASPMQYQNPYFYGPGSPQMQMQMNPMTGMPYFPTMNQSLTAGFGGAHITNHNSGNISNMNITNSNNDNSVNTHYGGSGKRRSKKR